MRNLRRTICVPFGAAAAALTLLVTTVSGQSAPPRAGGPAGTPAQTGNPAATAPGSASPATPAPPSDFVIGVDDVLTIVVWREKDLSGEVVVRPDGKISLPLLNEVQAAGLTTEQLRKNLTEAVTKFVEDPTVGVMVKQINSRKVFITGLVGKPGPYPLIEHMNVLQLISMAGGLQEYADKKNIVIISAEKRPDGVNWSYPFNYEEVMNRRNLQQNRELKNGDTVVVR